MRFSVYDKKAGVKIKKKIINVLNDKSPDGGFITVADVKKFCGGLAISNDDYYFGWEKEVYLLRKIRVRETKNGWYLYLPDPKYLVVNVEPSGEFMDENKNQDDDGDESYEFDILTILTCLINSLKEINEGRRKCMVWKKSRKKDVVAEEWPCWFHCWSSNRIVKDDGKVVDQLLAVCEYQDGHVERINYDHIRFVEEWD